MIDLAELRERAGSAAADHVFVDVRKDELVEMLDRIEKLRREIANHARQPAVHYQCNACGKRMKTWHEMEEYQHAECGGLVELAAVIAMRTERDTALARIADLERELAVERNSLRAQFDAVTAERACPCLYTTPCHERCTCVNQVSSIGCRRCCSYGSMEQRKAMAERLVNAERETAERIAQWLESLADKMCDSQGNAAGAGTAYGIAAHIRSGAWRAATERGK